MAHHFELRLTAAGRAALADGANRGIRAVSYTRMSVGSGFGPGGAGDDGRAALRNERDDAPVTGTTAVAGELALVAEIVASEDYDIRELGLWGRIGDRGAETLHAYWTDPTEIFSRSLTGTKTIVAGSLTVASSDAQVRTDASARVTLESQGLAPLWLLPPPHVETADHRLAVTPHVAANGGTVSVARDQRLSLGVPDASGDSAFSRAFRTPAWASQDLEANAVWYLRAQAAADGALQLYVQKGDAADAAPGTLKGTPGGAAGGGFSSTVLDARIARIATGPPGSAPAITRYALDATRAAGIAAWSAVEDYQHPAAAWGSDNELYLSVKASGPSAAGGAADPVTDADFSHWRPALKISALPEGAPARDDWVPFGDRSAAGRPNARVELRKVLAPLEEAGPAKDDVVVYRDESATGSPAKVVEVQKLLAALAPAGGLVTGRKYSLEALAGGILQLVAGPTLLVFWAVGAGAGITQAQLDPGDRRDSIVMDGASEWTIPHAGRWAAVSYARWSGFNSYANSSIVPYKNGVTTHAETYAISQSERRNGHLFDAYVDQLARGVKLSFRWESDGSVHNSKTATVHSAFAMIFEF